MKRLSKMTITAALCAALLVGCVSFASIVTLIGSLAVDFVSIYTGFAGASAADMAAAQKIDQGINGLTQTVVSAANTYDANKTAGNLAALEAALQSGVQGLPQLLEDFQIANPVLLGRISAGVTAILGTFQTLAAFEGITLTNSVTLKSGRIYQLPSATATKAEIKDALKTIKTKWNTQACPQLNGGPIKACRVK